MPTKKIGLALLATFAYNTAIAGLLTLLSLSSITPISFGHNFVFAQCIGFAIAFINGGLLLKLGDKRRLLLVLSLPVSIMLGLGLALLLTGDEQHSLQQLLHSLLIALFFGAIACITFLLFERIGRLNEEVKQRQLAQADSEKRQMEAQLKMLQAQIEPHFLFNTLANVSSLIDHDPALAKQLLERLNDWLRLALLRTRVAQTTLGDEWHILENYLQILKIRFGNNLNWQSNIEPAAAAAIFPPMLLQPLLENALQHGITPKLGGGTITINAHIQQTQLHIAVCDNGIGLSDTPNASGTGLMNVRARLNALFGSAGRLSLCSNPSGGVTTTLVLPYQCSME